MRRCCALRDPRPRPRGGRRPTRPRSQLLTEGRAGPLGLPVWSLPSAGTGHTLGSGAPRLPDPPFLIVFMTRTSKRRFPPAPPRLFNGWPFAAGRVLLLICLSVRPPILPPVRLLRTDSRIIIHSAGTRHDGPYLLDVQWEPRKQAPVSPTSPHVCVWYLLTFWTPRRPAPQPPLSPS